MGSRIDGRDDITHVLEFLLKPRQFIGVAVAQSCGEPGSQTDTRTFDEEFEFAQPARAGAVAELRGGLQHSTSAANCPIVRGPFGRRQQTLIASLTAPWAAATHARARLRS